MALYEKKLSQIIEYLVTNATQYYERDSVVSNSGCASLLTSLLEGPCTLDYSKTKTNDYFYSDPPASELIERHRITSGNSTQSTYGRPNKNFKRSLNASSDEGSSCSTPRITSFHQNPKETLLYGKNNVKVVPVSGDGLFVIKLMVGINCAIFSFKF